MFLLIFILIMMTGMISSLLSYHPHSFFTVIFLFQSSFILLIISLFICLIPILLRYSYPVYNSTDDIYEVGVGQCHGSVNPSSYIFLYSYLLFFLLIDILLNLLILSSLASLSSYCMVLFAFFSFMVLYSLLSSSHLSIFRLSSRRRKTLPSSLYHPGPLDLIAIILFGFFITFIVLGVLLLFLCFFRILLSFSLLLSGVVFVLFSFVVLYVLYLIFL